MAEEVEVTKECLQKQLDELDMLQSIYCNPGELRLHDQFTILDMREFLGGKYSILTSKLAYTLSLAHESYRHKVEINVELPHLYPALEVAYIAVRSAEFSKTQERAVSRLVEEYIENSCDKSEPYIFQVASWVQDSLESFLQTGQKGDKEGADSGIDLKMFLEYERLWIYSHHIKSKTKRQNIIRTARDLDLTGFMRPGKPGIICVEGLQENTQEFWKVIKQWNWHKIQIRKSEVKKSQTETRFGRFEDFREQLFTTRGEDDEEVPMDMGLFMKFLEQHSCAYIKEYLFGF